MLQQLQQGVALKKLSDASTGGQPSTDAEKSEKLRDAVQMEREQNQRLRQADIEFWYEALKEYTYETIFVPITPAHARAMMAGYRARLAGEAVGSDDLELLKSLQQAVDEGIKKLYSSTKDAKQMAVFAKMSSRSPKDARTCTEVARSIARNVLSVKKAEKQDLSTNNVIATVMSAGIASLKLTNAEAVLEAMLTSDRVCADDMPLALEHCSRVDVPIQYELRGFVMDGRLNGLCQYFNDVYFPDLVQNKQRVGQLVASFVDKVLPLIPLKPAEYVLDLAVDLNDQKVYVIEINPFGRPNGMGTGTIMFDKRNADDMKILFGEAKEDEEKEGDGGFVFRVETSPLPREQAVVFLGPEWKKYVQEDDKG